MTVFELFGHPSSTQLTYQSWPIIKRSQELSEQRQSNGSAEVELTAAQPLVLSVAEFVEEEKFYRLSFDLPGVKEDDIDISVEGSQLTVTAERRAHPVDTAVRKRLVDRRFGSYVRQLALPDEANLDSIEARLDQGVLDLTIGKLEAKQPRKISITTSGKSEAIIAH